MNRFDLIRVLSDGQLHSGADLAAHFQVSRTAIWKHVEQLAELGLDCERIHGQGYRLAKPLGLLDAHRIRQMMGSRAVDVIVLSEIDSTNRYLTERQKQIAGQTTLCVAEYQTGGRGRRGKHWVSPFAANLYFSMLQRFDVSISKILGLSLVVGVVVERVLRKMGCDGLGLKWPNDIVFYQKKLGGILIEVAGEAEGPCDAVVGIGLNVSMPEAVQIDQPWTDLHALLGAPVDRNELTASLVDELALAFEVFAKDGLAGFLEEWRTLDILDGQELTIEQGAKTFVGRGKGVADDGSLLVEIDGSVKALSSGEISVRWAAK